MRQIKFRAWDKKTNKMSLPFSLFGEFTLLGGVYEWQRDEGNDSKTSLEALNDLQIMQFTGLLDKNGKEIYERDICKGEYCASNAGIYINSIKWDIQSACFEFANSPLWTWEYLEIIGNIHETPELLKQ